MEKTRQLKIFAFSGKTDKGLLREENQDAFSYFETVNGSVFAVCDGMGGIPGGKNAANFTLKKLEKFFSADWYENEKTLIKDAVNYANSELRKKYGKEETGIYPGTTLVLVLIRDNKVFFANAGDSRIYYKTGGKLFRLTEDHSFAEKLLREKKISEKEAKNHPKKNIIYNAVGIKDSVQIDISEEPVIPADDDFILLCSDGLTNELTDKEISELLNQKEDIKEISKNLIKKALKNGGNDNITVGVIKFYNTGKKTNKTYSRKNNKKKHKATAFAIFLFLCVNAFFMYNYFSKTIVNNTKKDTFVKTDRLIFRKEKEYKFFPGFIFYAFPQAKRNSIIETLKYNNKKEFYFYPGETIKFPEKNKK